MSPCPKDFACGSFFIAHTDSRLNIEVVEENHQVGLRGEMTMTLLLEGKGTLITGAGSESVALPHSYLHGRVRA